MAHTVLLVDDHRILRDGIRAILEHTGEFRIVAEAEEAVEGLRLCRKHRPDLVLMDIALPGLSGVDATAEILRHCPDAKVTILSMYDDEHTVVGAIRSGARGYVLKKASHHDLLEALRIVARGGSYLSPEVSDRLLNRIQRGDGDAHSVSSVVSGLSPRETQVLRLVAEGKTSKEIAVLLDLGLQTVRTYRKTMMKKLGVCNVAGLTQLALAAGLTRLPAVARQDAPASLASPG
ncbi:MAG: response regulator transcription factor [Bryobacteraceae bacterium]|nr:response regulator transcription factor [Bryobacteraceae bacterium]